VITSNPVAEAAPPPSPAVPSTILIVDDIAANRDTLVELLASPDYRLVEAASGAEALALAAATPPDLVLLDVMMPGMDGFEVCRRLRSDPNLREVPVVLVTALDDQASRIVGIEAGADDFVSKPYNGAELRARVRTITRLNRYRSLLESQAALRESELRFRLLAEHSEEVFWLAAQSPARRTYVSPAVEKIWGLPPARFTADTSLWSSAIHPEDRGRVKAAYETLQAGKSSRFDEEYRVIRPDGSIRWVLDSGTPLPAGNGRFNLGGVARDITERKAASELLLRAQRLENIGMLAAGIAHDFNNALAPMVMCCGLLQPYVADPKGLHYLEMIAKSADHSVALVRQLLSFARGASGSRQLLQTRHVLRELIELATVTFPKSISLQAQLPAGLWPIQANATQIHQVFLNLCVNARDAMPEGGDLKITAANRTLDTAAAAAIPNARPGDFLVVSVRDSGTGIPPDVLARIFEPFFTTKGEGKGTGLGLSTVRGIVKQHDGFVTVETAVNRGTTFTVYLPATPDAEYVGGNGTVAEPAAGRGRGELILVVDDEEPVRAAVAMILTDGGYHVATAGDGAEAIALFALKPGEVRLLLTDLRMPVIGGAALAAVLRRLQPGLPIIAMSGVGSGNQKAETEFTPLFLAKPFHAQTVLAMVRQALDAVEPATNSSNFTPPLAGEHAKPWVASEGDAVGRSLPHSVPT
jgi:PAS domain S-box-containing protein